MSWTASGNAKRRRRLAMWLAVPVVALVQSPAAESASALRRIVPTVVRFASDGARFVAWEAADGSPVVVLDTQTGRRASVALAPGCSLRAESGHPARSGYGWPAAAGRFLVVCGERQKLLLDARTGATTSLPAFTGPYENAWENVGTRYVDGGANERLCPSSHLKAEELCFVIYNIATGAISHRPGSQVPDLDRAGAPAICPRLRKKVVAAEERSPRGEFAYADGVLVEPTHRRGGLAVERCRGHAALLGGPGEPENLDVRGGLLTWDTGTAGESFEVGEQLRHAWLFSYSFATHRRHSWALPHLRLNGEAAGLPTTGFFGYSTHTKNMVFWIATTYCHEGKVSACQTEQFSVYAASVK